MSGTESKPAGNPRLVGLDGPSEGAAVELSLKEQSLGRERANTIAVPDPSVSRRHCVFRRTDNGETRIEDCRSRNGTFVNGVPVDRRTLMHGDEIRVGNCHFLYLERHESDSTPKVVLRESSEEVNRTVVRIRREDSLFLQADQVLEMPVEPRRVAHALKALLRLGAGVRVTRGLEELSRTLMEVVAGTMPATESALLLFDRETRSPEWTFAWRRDNGGVGELAAPSDLVRRVLEEDAAVLCNHRRGDDRTGGSTSAVARHSMMLTPLRGAEGVFGVLYLASTDPQIEFDEEQLRLLTAIGVVAGLAAESALQFENLRAENRRLREELELDHDMVGESAAMTGVYRFIARVSPTATTVLITGESGTGKELAARAIHRNSSRRDAPFVAVNCAALTETLLESELFGHERGAFTGAVTRKKGKFEAADGGTLFLDEVIEMPPPLQVKLLRALQEREFERVGGTDPVRVDVRIVAATNRNVRNAVREGLLREDLYYRLNVVSFEMPPLRERKEDIPLLARYFASRSGRRVGRPVAGLSRAAGARLAAYEWPGNVRELENVIERAVVLGTGDKIQPEDLPEALLERPAEPDDSASGYHQAVREAKQAIILEALERAGGSQTGAAALLEINPTYLSRLIRNLDLKDKRSNVK